MNVQQHERIAQIKKLSGYMNVALRWGGYFLWLAWLFFVLSIMSGGDAKFRVGDYPILASELNYWERALLSLVVTAFIFLLILIVQHIRELMRYFHQGEIFNKAAIAHARKALHYALIVWGSCLMLGIVSWLYTVLVTHPMLKLGGGKVALKVNFAINGDIFIGLMFFGLMYLLLWSLEIGRDLNEESELTI
jgi:hypothetical protein